MLLSGLLLREGLPEEALEAAQARMQDASLQGDYFKPPYFQM